MDEKVFKKLEYDKIRELLAGYTFFEGGYQRAMQMRPVSDKVLIEQRLDETAEAMEALRFNEPSFLSSLKIIDTQLSKVKAMGVLSPGELWDIYLVLHASSQAKNYLKHLNKLPRLESLIFILWDNRELEKKLFMSIDEEGWVKDGASAELSSIRQQIANIKNRIRNYLQDFIRSEANQKMLQDILVTERDGRYVVPVRQEYRQEIKGIVHDESSSGATVFIEPAAVVEQNNSIRVLQIQEKREVERILRAFSEQLALYVDELRANMEIMSILDLIFARARMAYNINAYRPLINEQGIIRIERGCHPLLGDKAVPLDIELGTDYDILVITGPNTGGKTVALKTTGLLTLMAMSGMFIPARENSEIAIFENVFVDIGDEQSIEQSLSTFSSHMKNIISILDNVNENSLVILDELGAGTDPAEGASLARVILEELQRKKARVLVSTHQSELKTFAYQNSRVENACVEFDPISLSPTYKLSIGMPGQSNAFEIAGRLGLDDKLVERARSIMPKNEAELGHMIKQLKASQKQYEISRDSLQEQRTDLEKEKQALLEERKALYKEREEILSRARQEAEAYLREIRNEADEALNELKTLFKQKDEPPKWHEVEKRRHRIKSINSAGGLIHDIIEERMEHEVIPGDYVLIKTLNQKGYVLEGPNKQDEFLVQAGIMKLTVNHKDIVKSESPEEKEFKKRRNTYLEKARNISPEIDLRGKMAEEAILEVDKYLEDANLVGLSSVRIIHGKGTGALRKAIREYLKDHRYVKTFRDGMREEGSFGVTVVELIH